MNRKARHLLGAMLVVLCLWGPGLAAAQEHGAVAGILNQGFELLEQGKYDQAQKVYEGLLQKDPGHPLALNNLAAIKAKNGKYDQALQDLKQALVRAKGCRVLLNRVCDLNGVCAAYRLSEGQFGSEDLEAVVKSNIIMVEMARASRQGPK